MKHTRPDRGHGEDSRHGHHHHRRGKGGPGGRLFDYGELRLLLLAMIAGQPAHGYELMRALEARTGGSYSPSPGVIYPTLAWLEDMGYARVLAEGGRKSFSITDEGQAFYAANREAAEELLARIAQAEGTDRPVEPPQVTRGLENVRLALRLRLRSGPIEPPAAERIAAALDEAALIVERA